MGIICITDSDSAGSHFLVVRNSVVLAAGTWIVNEHFYVPVQFTRLSSAVGSIKKKVLDFILFSHVIVASTLSLLQSNYTTDVEL